MDVYKSRAIADVSGMCVCHFTISYFKLVTSLKKEILKEQSLSEIIKVIRIHFNSIFTISKGLNYPKVHPISG